LRLPSHSVSIEFANSPILGANETGAILLSSPSGIVPSKTPSENKSAFFEQLRRTVFSEILFQATNKPKFVVFIRMFLSLDVEMIQEWFVYKKV
jgi:hypothetical protein